MIALGYIVYEQHGDLALELHRINRLLFHRAHTMMCLCQIQKTSKPQSALFTPQHASNTQRRRTAASAPIIMTPGTRACARSP